MHSALLMPCLGRRRAAAQTAAMRSSQRRVRAWDGALQAVDWWRLATWLHTQSSLPPAPLPPPPHTHPRTHTHAHTNMQASRLTAFVTKQRRRARAAAGKAAWAALARELEAERCADTCAACPHACRRRWVARCTRLAPVQPRAAAPAIAPRSGWPTRPLKALAPHTRHPRRAADSGLLALLDATPSGAAAATATDCPRAAAALRAGAAALTAGADAARDLRASLLDQACHLATLARAAAAAAATGAGASSGTGQQQQQHAAAADVREALAGLRQDCEAEASRLGREAAVLAAECVLADHPLPMAGAAGAGGSGRGSGSCKPAGWGSAALSRAGSGEGLGPGAEGPNGERAPSGSGAAGEPSSGSLADGAGGGDGTAWRLEALAARHLLVAPAVKAGLRAACAAMLESHTQQTAALRAAGTPPAGAAHGSGGSGDGECSTGGWVWEEHALFLAARLQARRSALAGAARASGHAAGGGSGAAEGFLEQLALLMPGKAPQELRNHDDWCGGCRRCARGPGGGAACHAWQRRARFSAASACKQMPRVWTRCKGQTAQAPSLFTQVPGPLPAPASGRGAAVVARPPGRGVPGRLRVAAGRAAARGRGGRGRSCRATRVARRRGGEAAAVGGVEGGEGGGAARGGG